METVSGCIHDEILKVAPELKPIVDLHLSDLDGVPMHSVENGFYWLAKVAGIPQKYEPEQSLEKCTEYLQSHLRVGFAEALFTSGLIHDTYNQGKKKIATSEPVTEKCLEMQHEQGIFDAKNHFKKIVEDMKPRWKKEAKKALDLIAKL